MDRHDRLPTTATRRENLFEFQSDARYRWCNDTSNVFDDKRAKIVVPRLAISPAAHNQIIGQTDRVHDPDSCERKKNFARLSLQKFSRFQLENARRTGTMFTFGNITRNDGRRDNFAKTILRLRASVMTLNRLTENLNFYHFPPATVTLFVSSPTGSLDGEGKVLDFLFTQARASRNRQQRASRGFGGMCTKQKSQSQCAPPDHCYILAAAWQTSAAVTQSFSVNLC